MSRKHLALLLLAIFLLGLLSSGRWSVALAAWLGPVPALYLVHRSRPLRGLGLLLLATYPALLIGWRGVAPFPMPIYPIFMLVNVLVGLLPYALDRWLRPRLGAGLASTLAFPLAATAIEYLSLGNGPLGSFGAAAYGQHGLTALTQLAALTGPWGLTFLPAWGASFLYWAWQRQASGRAWTREAAAAALFLLGLVAWGGWRLQAAPAAGEAEATVSVAALTVEHTDMAALMGLHAEDPEAFAERTRERHAAYLAETRAVAASSGAEILVWPELAGLGLAEDVDALVEQGRALAVELGIYLTMPVFVVSEVEGEPSTNELYLVGPEGEVLLEHVKYGGNLIEGTEPGPQEIESVETPHGRLAAVICWDTDYPGVVRQAGQQGVDLLLSPSYVWPGVAEMHVEMAAFRAIENGLTVLRHSDDGLSQVIDPYGRVLASQSFVGSDAGVFVAEAPIARVSTRYPAWGDWLGRASALGLLLCALWALAGRWRERRAD